MQYKCYWIYFDLPGLVVRFCKTKPSTIFVFRVNSSAKLAPDSSKIRTRASSVDFVCCSSVTRSISSLVSFLDDIFEFSASSD